MVMASLSEGFLKKFELAFSRDATMLLVSLNEQLFFSQSIVVLSPLAQCLMGLRSSKVKALRFVFFVLSRFGLGYNFLKG